MLFSKYKLEDILKSRADFAPFPKSGDFEHDAETAENAAENADKYIDFDWQTLSAGLYMQFTQNGNRTAYEDINFARRKALACLVIGEYIVNDGRYIKDIIDGIWCICEESTWVIPAHNNNLPLARVGADTVDLFAAQTAAQLAFAMYLIGDKLNTVTPIICERIEYEIHRRVTMPILNNNYWWMGFGKDRRTSPSNWTAWCTSTCLCAVLLSENDGRLRIKAVKKLLECLDYYITAYPDDGGCDEGADYWAMSAGCMFDSLEMLYRASDGKINLFDMPKIKSMGEYIAKVHIGGEYFVNFADCSAKACIDGARTYLFAKRVNSEKLKRFSERMYHSKKDKTLPDSMNMLHKLFAVIPEFPIPTDTYLSDESVYIESLQLLTAKSAGTVLAVKGGHNADNHNHNDVGSYMVYIDNKPIIIDVGVESYSKKTFSSERYSIWTMQSAYHNLPTVNGIMQKDGREYRAENILVGNRSLQCELKNAYPDAANLKSWVRFSEISNGEVNIRDCFSFTEPTCDILNGIMVWYPPKIQGDIIRIANAQLIYPSKTWDCEIEKINIDYDAKLTPVWGECVYRLKFTPKTALSSGSFNIKVRRLV